MIVEELMEILKNANPKASVIISKDAEGNNYSPIGSVEKGHYISEAPHPGVFYSDAMGRKGHCFAICLVPLI